MDGTLDITQVRKALEAAGRGEGPEPGHRTGEWSMRHEFGPEQLLERQVQTITHMLYQLNRDLAIRTNDGRTYQTIIQTRVTVLVHPEQARVGEYVSPLELERCLGKHIESSQAQGLFGDEVRYFQRDKRHQWRRVDVPQGYKDER